jgi:RimJ/RimL family protein N-acetyltransferase
VVRRNWPWNRESVMSGPELIDPAHRPIVRRGQSVALGRHLAADRAAFISWYQDPIIAELLRHDLAPLTAIQARGYFDSIILPSSHRGLCWAIVEHESGALIGSTALVELDEATGNALFRIVIGEKQAWGHGYGTETTNLVLQEAFGRFDRKMVSLEVFQHNPRARRAYEKAGFRQVDQHQEWVSRVARQIDVVKMRITRDEWSARTTNTSPT